MVVKSDPQVEVLGWLERQASRHELVDGREGLDGIAALDGMARNEGSTPVLVRQGNVLASVFHPELTPDRRIHRLFVEMCGG
jgi:hypothetical protein